eukprot:Nitzschia sp. Nitz4//scaffold140_size61219//29533//49080//NITZ4_006440-RA/size61219-augustus-gene-0.64-mRNA-1//-1//CDS//3329536227//2078//frame0
MTSYISYPSHKVTEILSKFLEFDPSELELGIWSGDLQLKNLKLRQETIHPLLNKKANKPHVDPLKKAPLHLKLVKGTIGQMRIRIPWKRLVWGQGAVQIDVNELTVVLSFQSRQETEDQRKKGLLQTKNKKKKDKEDTGVSQAYRDAKQRRLREAEKRHLQGMPVALYLDALHRKNSIKRDVAKAEEAAKQQQQTKEPKKGRLEKWLANKGSDLFWRFFAGIQGSITKARIVIVQDGVEIGCIVQSIEIIAGKDGTKINVNMEDTSEGPSESAMTSAEMTPPENVTYESAYDDGEHVDKSIKQQGLGLFVRKEGNMAKVPQALRFSSSVSADDYILRPVDLDFSFSFFYPYPPERRKKRALDSQSQETPTTATATTSVGDNQSQASGSKRRRDKRDRVGSTPTNPSLAQHLGEDRRVERPAGSIAGSISRLTRTNSLNNERRRLHQRWLNADNRPGLQRYGSVRSGRSGTFHTPQNFDHMSIADTAALPQTKTNILVPRLDCRASLQEIRIVFTTRHYELLNYFLATVARMKNGRPDQTIRSTPKDNDTAALHRQLLEPLSPVPVEKEKPTRRIPNASMLTAMLAPLTGFGTGSMDDVSVVESDHDEENPMLLRRGLRAQAINRWWTYSIGAILWEVRKRKHLATNFRQMYISFDWKRQRHKRKEYVELYIAKRLDNKSNEGVFNFGEDDNREEQLLAIEDELPLEQILLYRSIARSVRVRGMTTMPDSIQQIHTARSAAHRKPRKPVSNPLAATKPSETSQDASLLGFIQGKFENSARLRLPGGIKEKWENQEKEEQSVETLVQGRPDNFGDDENDEMEVLSSEALPADGMVPPPAPAFGARFGRLGSGYDSTSESDGRVSTPRARHSKHSHLQTGSYYTSVANRRDSHADGRTIRTTQKKDAKSIRLGNSVEKEDERMKISFSLQIKCIDIMVVEENYLFDISPDAFRGGHGSGRISMGANSADGFSGGENSSSDDVSDLSGLTDDQRFFSEEGQIDAIAEEEEEDDERVRMHSTDFLLFGLPENPLLRLTIETLGCTVRGRGGGPFNIGLVVRNIGAVTDEGCRIFSLGANEPKTPVAEVSVASGGGRRSVDSGEYEGSSHGRYSHGTRAKLRDGVIDTGRAISLAWQKEGKSNDIQCDFSRLTINLDLTPARKMLNFYTKTDIKYPDRILEKSSRDVARKFMVYKTSIHGPTGALSTAIRVHDIELSVPIELLKSDSSEASDVAESRILDIDSGLDIQTSQKTCAVVLATEHLDVYTGSAVDEICAAASDMAVSRSSMFSGSRAGRRGATVKTLDMLDIVALTSANDAFACRHWVSTLGGIKCYVNEGDDYGVTRILDIPVDVECLATVNETSLLESDSPQTQVVMEVSPVHVFLSEKRLDSVRAAQAAMDFSFLNRSAPIIRKKKPDPPRIEILSPRILHSIDLNCKRVQVAVVRDSEELEQSIVSPKLKEVIMEECLADFLSVVSCFDFSLPNEEALSSAMQVCIGRLVGLGLSDDEAWGCTNAARLNFLDDIALMRQAQSDALIQLSTSIRRESSYMMKAPVLEEDSENQDSSSAQSYSEESEQPIEDSDSSTSSQTTEETDDVTDDDDSANSAEIVETTLHNAVEKTIATFAPLLQGYSKDMKDLNVDIIVSMDLPMGFRTSVVKLFYDQHVAVLVTSVVATNAAGIELLTLVPHHEEEDGSVDDDQEVAPGRGLCFTRYDFDKEYEFGKGGLPMAALASDDVDEETTVHRERARVDDIEVGEVEMLFASKIYEGIIDDFGNLSNKSADEAPKNKQDHKTRDGSNDLRPSMITTANSVSVLFTSDEMVPFSRLTLEKMTYRTTKALEETLPSASEIPTWSVVSENASLQNLTPEGQFYPNSLALISPGKDTIDSPFAIRFYSSPEPWKASSKLDIDFRGFRLFLLRQFIYEILHFFVYDKYGVGRLKKKYSKDNFDKYGNSKPPLLWMVNVFNSSIICPRCSTSSDMVAFEVEKAMIAISYVPQTFEMPTATTDFYRNPMGSATAEESTRFDRTAKRRFSSSSTTSEYHECVEVDGDSSLEFISAYSSKDLTKRMTITLDKVNAFTVIAEDDITRDLVESPLFRFTHQVDGRASDGKLVYAKKANLDRLTAEAREAALDDSDQRWEQINTSLLFAEVLVDYAPHMRLFIGSRHSPFTLDARLSQLCLLVCIWDSNMQEMPNLFPFTPDQVTHSATPPKLPSDFPEYGSEDWVSMVETTPTIKSEICCIFKHLALRCTFDKPGHFPVDPACFQYFEDPSCHDDVKPGLVLKLDDATVHVVNDFYNVKRIGVGSSSLELVDERRVSAFQTVLVTEPMVNHDGEVSSRAWADVRWGLRNDIRTFGSSLPLPVQCTVIMSPGWSLINVGAQSANGVMHELSWIWLFLDYFKSYWSDAAFGNPGHQAQRWTHKVKNAIRKANGDEPVKFEPLPGINVDFRLWLCKPVLCIPSDYVSPQAPSIRIESRTGLWYRYKSVRTLSSQEVSTTDLNLHFVNEFQEPAVRRRSNMRDGIEAGRPLVEALSFGLRYDSMNEFNHKDIAVKIPYAGEDIADLSVAGKEVDVTPEVLPLPVVCKPVQSYKRGLGPKVCEITCIIEVLPLTSSVLGNFFGGPSERHPDYIVEEEDQGPPTYSVAAEAGDLRIFAIDPILGVQLPVGVASLGSLRFTLTKFSPSPIPLDLGQAEPPVDDFQVTLRSQVWADYFKLGITRSWEPLLEPVEILLLHEQAKERGRGLSVSADSPLQFTLSGALLEVLGETLESFSGLVSETFGKKTHAMQRSMSFSAPAQDRAGAMVEDSLQKRGGQTLQVLHEIPKPLKAEDRVAFSLRNLTGQKVRVHQQTDIAQNHSTNKPTIITYVNQNATMGLTFAATISVIKNLTVVEVPYPGFRDSGSNRRNQGLLMHAVDIQVPGFRWIQGLSVDTFGRRFEPLIPRSPELKSKIEKDWRLQNTMMVLAEVGLDNGGRLVTVRAIFEVKNSTTHPIKLVFDPDPRRRPLERSPERHDGDLSPNRDTDSLVDGSVVSQFYFTAKDDIEVIMPGDTLQIPTLLLEKSLQASGSHLGALWVCPETTDNSLSCWDFFRTNGVSTEDELQASFCSRPIQLAKLVHESSLIFQESMGRDVAAEDASTGIQVSCPTRAKKGGGRAPFCYAIEVGRSPLVSTRRDNSTAGADGGTPQGPSVSRKKSGIDRKVRKPVEKTHGPVAYSLSIHAPLVIVNLLPEGGRFELMHAVRKTVVWFADLEPGQQVPVHSVGLDAPLLLLVNLGFCRTPVGEGALVHHGVDAVVGAKDPGVRLKDIGKAALKGTKHIGKTLTSMSNTSDRRGQGKLAHVSAPQFYNRQNKRDKARMVHTTGQQGSLGTDNEDFEVVGGKVHSVDNVTYSQNDIATSTTVVDSIGQRLSLCIENLRGGGGQRRVSLFCPFWIVNTTEHSLRYKQEKGKTYVSGTVSSPERDGSKPVDGSNRNYKNHYSMQMTKRKSSRRVVLDARETGIAPMNTKTIFSGTPGALATAPGRCDLSETELSQMVDKDVPLEQLAKMAFMFNFHEEGLAGGHQMLCVQLYDGTGNLTYSSDWSKGFSLESVGFSQIVVMTMKDGRTMELSAEVNVAPGFLASYTKIVRFLPRYIMYNRLELPIRLWQDSSVFRAVNEDRMATVGVDEPAMESRKWRFEFEDKSHNEKINQYEMLYGRTTTIKDHTISGRIPQGTTAHRSAQYITSVGASEMVPFMLPDTRAERQLRVDLGGIWNMTSSFASDLPGEHTLKVSRATDISQLNHVSTRAAPKYKIVLPPPRDSATGEWDGELGVFFETDWGGDKRIIVKGTKRGKFAYNHTDIRVGDELLRVDGVSVLRMTFAETMKLIKERVTAIQSYIENHTHQDADPGRKPRRRLSFGARRRNSGGSVDQAGLQPPRLTLTFRTLEERLRKSRMKASGAGDSNPSSQLRDSMGPTDNTQDEFEQTNEFNVELKSIHNTMFVILRSPVNENPAFQIQNRSINHIIFYRQRGCGGHPWNFLMPGQSLPYSWEEPMMSKKLTVRVAAKTQEIFKVNNNDVASYDGSTSGNGDDVEQSKAANEDAATSDHENQAARASRLRQALAVQFVDTEERGGFGPSITVRLEEIGYRTLLPLPWKEGGRGTQRMRKFLNCEVDTDGGTRLLIVSDDPAFNDENNNENILTKHLDTLKKQIAYEQQRITGLHSLEYLLQKETFGGNSTDEVSAQQAERIEVIEGDARRFVEDFSEDSTILCRNQVVVEVLEAVGLNGSEFVGSCNPYCEVYLKGRSKSRQYFFQKRRNKRKTYYIERSLNPRWTDQVFVFDVPDQAVQVTRGHHILLRLRNFRLVGQHPVMGQASVHLGSLRNQKELIGWYPLAGRTGRSDLETAQLSDVSKGSVKLRVQWVYTTAALIDYFLILSEARLERLQKSYDGMSGQLAHAIDADERKREAKENVNAGRIIKMAQVQRRGAENGVQNADRAVRRRRNRAIEKTPDMLNDELNQRLSGMRDTLKSSRDRYLYALYFQTAESKRNRQLRGEIEGSQSVEDSPNGSAMVGELGAYLDQRSAGSIGSSLERGQAQPQSSRSYTKSPHGASSSQRNKQSLDDFFAKHKSPGAPSPFQGGQIGLSPRHPLRPRLDSDKVRRQMNHRRLSMNMDVDEGQGDDDNIENAEQWQPSLLQGQALYDGILGQVPDLGLSDLISVSTDIDEEAKRRRNTIVLMSLGFTFHEMGKFFHEDHLPRHFRRSLLAGSIESRRPNRLYRPRFAVGAPAEIRHFKSWQAAGTMHWDPHLQVKQNEDSFSVQLKTKVTKPSVVDTSGSDLKDFITERLRVPDCAQAATKERAAARVDLLYLSRTRFERFANRMLGSALNPGGWLTVRPITALNLPDAYTGMYVKLRYGGEVLVSETVNAKVTPRWGSTIVTDTPGDGRRSMVSRKSMGPKKIVDEELQKFKFTENDLHVHVEPQQTSGTIKLSVMAERMNNKAELGVLEIPLGAAIAACLDNVDDENESAADTIFSLPTYTRWFPLKSSRMAVSMEGDMGLSARPNESEKPRDNMFQQYFAPCIQLAFIWWPDDTSSGNKDLRKVDDQNSDAQPSTHGDVPLIRKAPSVNSYFNFDFSRISLALIDSQRATELLALTVMDVESRYSVTKSKTRIGLVIGWVQMDNHDTRTREPVVFAPTPSEGMQPTLQILALKDNLRTKSSIVSFEYVGVAFQEMDLTVEESWVFELWEFITGVMRRRTARKVSLNGKRRADFLLTTKNCFVSDEDSDNVALLDVLQGTDQGGPGSNNSKVYIEQLILGLVKVNLSYVKGKKQSYEMSNRGARVLKSLEAGELPNLGFAANRESIGQLGRSDQSETFARWSQHMYDDELIDRNGYNLPAIIAAVFPSVSDAPIRLQGKVIDHVFESSGEVVSSIKNFYVNETLKQVYKIIGSLDFVGNPTILFSSFVSGMRDLVATPTSAFLKSPTNVNQVGIAVGKGTLSLFSHSASGIFGFAAKMSATAGQTAAILSLDAEYRRWHRDRIVTEVTNMNRVYKRRGVQSVPEMLTRPVTDILLGLAMGASGIVVSPYKGYKNGGGLGLVHGVAVGTLGVVAKPLVGVLDALTHMSATVHDVAKSVNVLERRLQPPSKLRLPYTFGPLKVLAPFDTNAARSVLLLQIFPPKGRLGFVRRKKQETHIHCEVLNMEPGVETYAIVTTIRVVLIRLKKEVNGNLVPSFGWEVDLSQKGTVSSRLSDHGHNGVALTVTRRIVKQKRLQEAKERIWRGKRQQEVSRSPLLSSASSVGSLYSDLEEDEEDFDPDAEIGSTDDLQVNEEKDPEEGEHTINHGSTKQGEEVLKWYTVLAEYQHRGQLTVLHNLVSSMVGDFDAVVAERPQDIDSEVEGVSRFGMFSFGRDRQGVAHTATRYDELVYALERLPWMPEDIFIELQNYTLQKRREFVAALRQNWVYATDLEASRRDGGPEWLVESRARAMHVNSDLAVDVEYVDSEDPVVRDVLVELEQGNITTEQASDLIRSRSIRNLSFTTGEGYDSRYSEGSDKSLSYPRVDNTEVSSYVEESIEGSNRRPPAAEVQTQPKDERDEEISVIQSSVVAVTPAGEVKTVKSSAESVPPTAAPPTPVMTPQPTVKEVMVVSNVDAKTPASHLTDMEHDRDANSMRMNRMENIVEQLVILNTNQIRKVAAVKSTDSVSDSHSVGKDLKVADVLKKELEDLRNQVQARAAEDDALRNEISLLRQQLADRRVTSGTPMAERQRRIIPVPDLLRFGTAGKKEGETPRESLLPDPRKLAVPDLLRFGKKQDRESGDPPSSPKPSVGARKQAASQEGMVYREPLKDAPGPSTTPGPPKSQGKRPRRMSGGGMVVRRQSGDTMGGGSHSKRAPRRPSTGSISSTGDNLQPRNTRRHSADGVRNPGERRPARRMSAGHLTPR